MYIILKKPLNLGGFLMNITINNIENIFFIVKKMLSLWLKYKLINMKKTTFSDFKQNRTLKTKRWLGWLTFCMMMLFGHVGMAQSQSACEIEINLTFPEYGDGTEWELIDGSGNAVL